MHINISPKYIQAYIRSCLKKYNFSKKGLIYFDKYDKMGDYHWRHYYKNKTEFYVNLVNTIVGLTPSDSHILDVGCGDGLGAHRIYKERNSKVTGIDINPIAIYYAKKNNRPNPNCFIEKSIYEFDGSRQYDGVVVSEVFEHVDRPELLLAKIKELIKEKGSLIITTPVADPERALSKYHHKEYSEEEFVSFLDVHGFSVKKKKYLLNDADGSRIIVALCDEREPSHNVS